MKFLVIGLLLFFTTGVGVASPFLVSDPYPLQTCPSPPSCSVQPPICPQPIECIPNQNCVTKINTLQPLEFSVKINGGTPSISPSKVLGTGQVQLYYDLKDLKSAEAIYTIKVIAQHKLGSISIVSCPVTITIDTHKPTVLKGFSIIK